jgi:hypothetical protein
MRVIGIITSLVLLAACGSSDAAPARSAADAREVTAAPPEPAEEAASLIPGCKADDVNCMPPARWVDKLCGGVHPEVALHMFRGGSPWKRVYSRYRAPAYNGTGGPSVSDDRVEKGEELIALRHNSDARGSTAGEMTVGDTSGYDLLRWNGSCVTLHDGEYSERAPRRRVHARVEWRWLGDDIRSALQTDGTIKEAYVARRKECKGATIGSVSKKCVEQEDLLVAAIVDYVRAGGQLPEPNEQL